MRSGSRRAQQPTSVWQDRLEEMCRDYQIQPPDYQLVSDRRGKSLAAIMLALCAKYPSLALINTSLSGGRTAWSSVVVVYGQRIEARYWYDGNNLNNAREDAAEAALHWLSNSSGLSSGW
ncbi:hypothetical protein F5Y08DRAFT_222304 [Xylaria arbuscula]|nr:hypothetical protein F5Y08DRAFT_222304 [Xylaria arbuscula]